MLATCRVHAALDARPPGDEVQQTDPGGPDTDPRLRSARLIDGGEHRGGGLVAEVAVGRGDVLGCDALDLADPGLTTDGQAARWVFLGVDRQRNRRVARSTASRAAG